VKATKDRTAFDFMRTDLADEGPIAQEKKPVQKNAVRLLTLPP
jgi:hypothetical protein